MADPITRPGVYNTETGEYEDGRAKPYVDVTTKEGSSTSVESKINSENRHNDSLPWIVGLAFVAAFALCASITAIILIFDERTDRHLVENTMRSQYMEELNNYKVEDRTKENVGASERWRIINHTTDLEKDIGVLQRTCRR